MNAIGLRELLSLPWRGAYPRPGNRAIQHMAAEDVIE